MPRGTGKINTPPSGGVFFHTPRKPKSHKPGPVKLRMHGKLCGCTFTYKDGFVYKCKAHKALREARLERTKQANKHVQAMPKPKPAKKKKFPSDPPELVEAIRAEVDRLSVIAREARAAIKKPTKKLTAKQLASLHENAFTAEQVRADLTAK